MPGSESHGPARKPRNALPEHSFIAALSRFWEQSYASDYVGLILLVLAFIFVQFFMEPFHRMFYLSDPRIQFPHAEIERVPVSWLFVYAAAIPLAILIAWTFVFRPNIQKAHVTLLGLLISIVLTTFITDVIKNAVGRPRPDLIARCKPPADLPKDKLLSFEICTETNHHVLHDGWRSFPSGHSSFSFSGLGYLGIFFISQLYVFRPRADLARVLLALAPFLGAALIAISRLEDYRHDVFDVVVGSLIGASIAYCTWRRYYPPLSSNRCSEPYAVLDEGNIKQSFSRLRDEEEMAGAEREFELSDEDAGYPLAPQRAPQ